MLDLQTEEVGYAKKETYKKKPNSASGMPKLPADAEGDRSASRNSDKVMIPSGVAKALLLSQQQYNAASAQVERFRVLLREKELDLHDTKAENALLKQV